MLTSQQADSATVATTVHGRYLVQPGAPERVLVGFHGYAENAEIHLEAVSKIPGLEAWTLVSVQALHPFYASRTQQVVASWMTSQDRDLAIADNIAYVRSIVGRLPEAKTIVFLGFSQGAAMAYRAAASIRCSGLIALGGDVPPDATGNLPPVLIGRGMRDEWYSHEKLEKDLKLLQGVTSVSSCVYDGGHEWTDEFRIAASEFLARIVAL